MPNKQAVWIKFLSEEEIGEVLQSALSKGIPSPFSVLERWMEVWGPLPTPIWVTMKVVPLHIWHEEAFRMIGNCIGCTMEVDQKTNAKEVLEEGKIKVVLENVTSLPMSLHLWVEEIKYTVLVEREGLIEERGYTCISCRGKRKRWER